jgi:hypothetical protein
MQNTNEGTLLKQGYYKVKLRTEPKNHEIIIDSGLYEFDESSIWHKGIYYRDTYGYRHIIPVGDRVSRNKYPDDSIPMDFRILEKLP